jgi:hypothetical protein
MKETTKDVAKTHRDAMKDALHTQRMILQNDLDKLTNPIEKSVHGLVSDKNIFLKEQEKDQLLLKVGSTLNNVANRAWQNFNETHSSNIPDAVKQLGKDAEKIMDGYKKLMENRKSLEERGLQAQVFAGGHAKELHMIGGYMHSIFDKTTPAMIDMIESEWKSGKTPREVADKVRKELGVFMDDKNVIAIVRGLVISYIPQEIKNEDMRIFVNAVVRNISGEKLSWEDRAGYGLKDKEYTGIKKAVELVTARNPLAEAFDFFQRNYPEVRLGNESKDVTIQLTKMGPTEIKIRLGDSTMSAVAYRLEGGGNALKRFNVHENGGVHWDVEGNKPEITSSGRLAAFVFAQPKELYLRTLFYEQMVPCREEAVINGMKTSDGRKLWHELKEDLKLGDKDSFVVFVAERGLVNEIAGRFKDRLSMIQQKGGDAIMEDISKRAASETPIGEIGRDVHPFIKSEVQLSVMIERALGKERLQDEL